tara:strand:+ start:522 stop:911 length:390 start_codon:yes stop_codon:yes gene_type:complete
MSILDKAKIGTSVKVNLDSSKDRLNKETIDAINVSSIGVISDFRITDGKEIGVVLKLSNGKEQWFFENEINIIDDNGNIIEKNIISNEDLDLKPEFLKALKYEKKNNINELLNPINFAIWLIASLKDIL